MHIVRLLLLVGGLALSGCLVEPIEEAKVADDLGEEIGEVPDELHDHDDVGMMAKGNEGPCPLPKVQLCHLPSRDPEKAITLCISASAVGTHQFHHGDSLGACPEVPACAKKSEACSDDVACCTGACIAGACRATCQPYGEVCFVDSDCCNGAGCDDGLCTPHV
jgi:hypothetical protein